MQTLLNALQTAATTIVQLFVNFFQGLSEAFIYTPTGGSEQVTFIGGVLVIGLVVMLAMMLLRWIISLVRGI